MKIVYTLWSLLFLVLTLAAAAAATAELSLPSTLAGWVDIVVVEGNKASAVPRPLLPGTAEELGRQLSVSLTDKSGTTVRTTSVEAGTMVFQVPAAASAAQGVLLVPDSFALHRGRDVVPLQTDRAASALTSDLAGPASLHFRLVLRAPAGAGVTVGAAKAGTRSAAAAAAEAEEENVSLANSLVVVLCMAGALYGLWTARGSVLSFLERPSNFKMPKPKKIVYAK